MSDVTEKPRVLIIDDSISSVRILGEGLKGEYAVSFALNGEEGLKIAAGESQPDLIMLDIMMPVMDGYEVCKHLKEDERTKHIPVIFISAITEEEDETAGLELGAVDFIAKPFSMPIIRARVKSQVTLKKAMDQVQHINENLEELVETQTREVKEAYASLELAEEQYRDIFEYAVEGIFQASTEGEILIANPALAGILGFEDPSEMLLAVKKGYRPIPDQKVVEELVSILATDEAVMGFEAELSKKDGALVWCALHARPVFDAEGNLIWLEGFVEDITARMEKERAERERQAAEAANKAKNDFIATISHELRTPMNSILGLTDVALQTDLDEEQRDYLETARDSALHLLDIINDILDISKIEAKKLELEQLDFDLNLALQSTSKTMSVIAEQKGLALELDIDPQTPRFVKGDPGRLRQILVNLLGNAIKFTDRGHVRLFARPMLPNPGDGRLGLEFSVHDTGRGIPADKLEDIFKHYSQGHQSTAREFGGTGLGLAICNQIVDMMGGKIVVHSEVGEGSVFTFTVFLAPGDEDSVKNAGVRTEMAQAKNDEPALCLSVLVAEDSPANAKVAEIHLKRLGCTPTLVRNGNEVLDFLRKQVFDVVLLDVEMPGLGGFEACRQIRLEEASWSNVPVVAMTGHFSAESKKQCLDAGMTDFVAKPASFMELASALRRVASLDQGALERHECVEVPGAAQNLWDKNSARKALDLAEEDFEQVLLVAWRELPGRMSNIERALEQDALTDVRLNAHTIKSTAASVGAMQVRDLSLMMESAAEAEDLSRAKALSQPLSNALNTFFSAVQKAAC